MKGLEKADVLILGLFEGDKDGYKSYNQDLSADLERALNRHVFSTKFGEEYATRVSSLPYLKILVVGLGKKEELTVEKIRRVLTRGVKFAKAEKAGSLATNVVEMSGRNDEQLGRAAAEGILLADYVFTKYLSKEKSEKEKSLKDISVQYSKAGKFHEGFNAGKIIAEATNYVRDLVNDPAGSMTPTQMELEAKKLSDKVKVTVLNANEMKKEGLNAILGVSAGSNQPPKLIILEYNGGKGKPIALVGKGITFDSGGLNLKPTGYIETMKDDMSGAAAVLGTLKVAAQLGLKKNIVGVMPMCENLTGGSAQKPGDIVRAYNGKTIEINNTDAEGRLVLADALSYAEKKFQPEIMLDLATLTGSCVSALGNHIAGIMTKDDALFLELQQAGEKSYDRVWRLPLLEEYLDYMDGTISDLKNCHTHGTGREAGAITGGVFLSKFVEKARWAHIDIAGTAFLLEERDYLGKGATGSGVRLLSYWLMEE